MGQHLLRISIHEDDNTIEFTPEGRIAGPWVAELKRAWQETAARVAEKKLSLDLRSVTYADAAGKRALRQIFSECGAELITNSPWSQYLADEIRINQQQEEA